MKTTLPERSLFIKERLDDITKEILAVAKRKIAMIILFGSYARGDWVQDEYKEGHIIYVYQSDFDIMVVVKSKHGGYFERSKIETSIQTRLRQRGLRSYLSFKQPSITLVVESLTDVNKHLEEKQYFFTDIKREGVVLYDSGEFTLAEAKDLSREERKEIAKRDYKQWFVGGSNFLKITKFSITEDMFNEAAFSLHQATESFYNAILLVFSGYKPKTHDILILGEKARGYNKELFGVFPYETEEQKNVLNYLRKLILVQDMTMTIR